MAQVPYTALGKAHRKRVYVSDNQPYSEHTFLYFIFPIPVNPLMQRVLHGFSCRTKRRKAAVHRLLVYGVNKCNPQGLHAPRKSRFQGVYGVR